MYWMFLGWPNASCWRYFAIKRDLRSTSRTIKMNPEVIKNLKKTLTGKASNCAPGFSCCLQTRAVNRSFVSSRYNSEVYYTTKLYQKQQKISIEIWLILPVVICLFQGLSHACLRITAFAGICAWLITSDENCRNHFAVSARLDTLAKCQANTWIWWAYSVPRWGGACTEPAVSRSANEWN